MAVMNGQYKHPQSAYSQGFKELINVMLTVDPAKRNSVTDNISTAVTGNQTRDACVKLMYDGLAFMSEEGMLH